MLIPLSTDRPFKRRPIVNESLVVLNVALYVFTLAGFNFDWFPREAVADFGAFVMADFTPWQLITYQFIHDPHGIGHILFNMIFLWVFGNAVEARLGRIGYLAFYLSAGIMAGLLHGLLEPRVAVIGASGSISGVTGAFLCLFPRSRVRVIYFFGIIGVMSISATWLILLYFAIDLVSQFMNVLGIGGGGVAYAAHLGGTAYGFGLCFGLLASGLLKREDTDVFFLFKQMRRRATFRRAVRSAPGVWEQPKAESAEGMGRNKSAGEMTAEERSAAEARAAVSALVAAHDLPAAAAKYRALREAEPSIVLPEARQLDLANYLFQQNDPLATGAYERLLAAFPASRHADQVRLMLAVIYTRRRRDEPRARELIEAARPRLAAPDAALAQQLLEELEHAHS